MESKIGVSIFGVSGYTGIELLRLLSSHPVFKVTSVHANKNAGSHIGDIYPHMSVLKTVPKISPTDDAAISSIPEDVSVVFLALPHGYSHHAVRILPSHVRVIDLSGDFRLKARNEYEKWYGAPHNAMDLQDSAVFGIPELYRDKICNAHLIANPGCYVTSILIPLVPLIKRGVISIDGIVIDSKSGISGAGRLPTQPAHYCEASEGITAYGICTHRHNGEISQELCIAAEGRPVDFRFVPHLLPQKRGIMSTIYVEGSASTIHKTLTECYQNEPFVKILNEGSIPSTHHVNASNMLMIGVAQDNNPKYSFIVSCLDNLIKGASGQALQNANIACGLPEIYGLDTPPVFP